MGENNHSQKSSISKAGTSEEIGEFWDNHSLEDHWNHTQEVEFEVRAQQSHGVTVDPERYERC
jgi:hypothetical protein